MNASFTAQGSDRSNGEQACSPDSERPSPDSLSASRGFSLAGWIDDVIDRLAPCPWDGSCGRSPFGRPSQALAVKRPLYTADERRRRDASPWTIVQAVLAPLQFVAFAISLGLVVRYLMTGQGYQIATISILVKTFALYAIMITGSIWEKEVFGKWLFAPAFFWEDVFSMLVLGLQTAYLAALITGWGSSRAQMMIAVAAYGAYAINATQFLLKLRAARLEGRSSISSPSGRMGQLA